MGPSEQTTRRAQSTEAIAKAGFKPAIHWVFPLARARVTPLVGSRFLLGRAEECNLVLEGAEASRHHAEIRFEAPIHVLRDLDSTNGVFLNGERIKEAPLGLGAVIRLGEWIGVVVQIKESATEYSANPCKLGPRLICGSAFSAALEPAQRAASAELPIIVQGETGTGKECVARAVHEWSNRSGPFLAVNCAALPESLTEGELFGYRRGAFTGADRANPGYFRAAQGGTLLLDEILELPHSLQAKLLRVLEQREVLPLGQPTPVAVDVRVIAAAQESLAAAVSEKHFRADLYARLDGLTVVLPPLRDRIEDIPGLLAHFLQEHSGGQLPEVEPKLVEQLILYD